MKNYQVAEKVYQLHNIQIAERALLNQIIRYDLNNKKFHASNEYLSKYWGVSERTVTRWITHLEKQGYIQTSEIKKKHEENKWSNRRTIIPMYDAILNSDPIIPTEVEDFGPNTSSIEKNQPEIATIPKVDLEEKIEPTEQEVETIEPINQIHFDGQPYSKDRVVNVSNFLKFIGYHSSPLDVKDILKELYNTSVYVHQADLYSIYKVLIELHTNEDNSMNEDIYHNMKCFKDAKYGEMINIEAPLKNEAIDEKSKMIDDILDYKKDTEQYSKSPKAINIDNNEDDDLYNDPKGDNQNNEYTKMLFGI